MAGVNAQNWQSQTVLLLNVTYEALEDISAQRAVGLVATGAAVSYQDATPEFLVRSKSLVIPLPRVVVLRHYAEVKFHVLVHDDSHASAAGVLKRDDYRCAYCSEYASTIDHVMPQSRGGPNSWSNLVAACLSCNNSKGDRTPEEAGMTLLWVPRVPKWDRKQQRTIWRTLAAVQHEYDHGRPRGATA